MLNYEQIKIKGSENTMSAPKDYKQFHTYFSPNEWQIICKRAEQVSLTPGKFIKQISIRGDIKIYDMKDVIDLTIAINKIGNNINQIARVDNDTGKVFATDIKKINSEIIEIKNELDRYIQPLNFKNSDEINEKE